MTRIHALAVGLLVLTTFTTAHADITPVAEFQGDLSDPLNFGTIMAVQTLDVFGGAGTLSNLSEGGAIKVEFNSSLDGDLVTPRSGPTMAGQLGIGRWDFDSPAVRFGGWFENNSGADDATLNFYDAGQNLLGSAIASIPVAGGSWVWNGWESDAPFTRVEVIGNGLINGFIWYDDMQLTFVPEPATAALLLIPLIGLTARQRR
jgi:hypothetical protein